MTCLLGGRPRTKRQLTEAPPSAEYSVVMLFVSEFLDPRSPRSLVRFQEPVHVLATQALAIDIESYADASPEVIVAELEPCVSAILNRARDLMDAILSSCEETLPAVKRKLLTDEKFAPPPREVQLVAFVAYEDLEERIELTRAHHHTSQRLAEYATSVSLVLTALRAIDASIARAAAVERLLEHTSPPR